MAMGPEAATILARRHRGPFGLSASRTVLWGVVAVVVAITVIFLLDHSLPGLERLIAAFGAVRQGGW
jgi:hypothetical protein